MDRWPFQIPSCLRWPYKCVGLNISVIKATQNSLQPTDVIIRFQHPNFNVVLSGPQQSRSGLALGIKACLNQQITETSKTAQSRSVSCLRLKSQVGECEIVRPSSCWSEETFPGAPSLSSGRRGSGNTLAPIQHCPVLSLFLFIFFFFSEAGVEMCLYFAHPLEPVPSLQKREIPIPINFLWLSQQPKF